MTSYSRQAILVGLTVTFAVFLAVLFGLFEAVERETIDLRFGYARWRDDPMSDEIRFVDIDDGALESIGRWPWDRTALADAIGELDVLYVNRLQRERLPKDLDVRVVEEIARQYSIDATTMADARPGCLIMHPLPRVNELSRELDEDPRAIYFEQSSNGVPVRISGWVQGPFGRAGVLLVLAGTDLATFRMSPWFRVRPRRQSRASVVTSIRTGPSFAGIVFAAAGSFA